MYNMEITNFGNFGRLRFLIIKGKRLGGLNQIENEKAIIHLVKELGLIDSYKKETNLKGIPDFICVRGEKDIWVEVKLNQDGLRIDQIDWILKNYEKEILIIFYNESNYEVLENEP